MDALEDGGWMTRGGNGCVRECGRGAAQESAHTAHSTFALSRPVSNVAVTFVWVLSSGPPLTLGIGEDTKIEVELVERKHVSALVCPL